MAPSYPAVIAIDFGTARTGYGYAFTANGVPCLNPQWHNAGNYIKTLTMLLLKATDLSLVAFGFEARSKFSELSEEEAKKHLLFAEFKMELYNKEGRTGKVKAMNADVTVDIKHLIKLVLSIIKDKAMGDLNNASSLPLTAYKLMWVITVPAIWDNAAKQVMLAAAAEAGMCPPGNSENIVIALEPEAATLYCRSPDIAGVSVSMEEGTKYMVIDAGGGTVDITCHKQGKYSLEELIPPSGGDWGSTYINLNFEKFMGEVFGKDIIKAFKQTQFWISMFDEFEAIKLDCTDETLTDPVKNINIACLLPELRGKNPNDLIAQYNKNKGGTPITLSRNVVMRVPYSVIKPLFVPLINNIIQHVKSLLSTPALRDLKYIFLVGGFAESPILQSFIMKEFNKNGIKVIVPANPGRAVIIGAVQFGLDPNIVEARISPVTIGVETLEPWDSSKAAGGEKVTHNGIEYCKYKLDAFIHAGDKINRGHEVRRTYTPVDPSQSKVELLIFSSAKPVVFYTTDLHCSYKGILSMDIPNKGKPNESRKVDVIMKFGGTSYAIDAIYQTTGEKVHAEFDFALGILISRSFTIDYQYSSNRAPEAKASSQLRCVLRDEAKNKAIEISDGIVNAFPHLRYRFSFVGYRDIKDKNRFEVAEFTDKIHDIKQHIGTIIATGGDDTPEDIMGAFQQVMSLSWNGVTRVMIHIADAPCHGIKYHNCSDDYPDGDPNGIEPETMLQAMTDSQIDYYFFQINKSTDQMINVFKTLYHRKLETVSLGSDVAAFCPRVLECITTSVTAYRGQ